MKTYERYKDSGIEWIGEIPEHWKVKKLKYLVNDRLMYGANESAIEENPQHPRFIRITDFGNDGKIKENTFKSLPPDRAHGFLLEDGDILFARSGATVGKTFQFKDFKGKACFAGYLIKASPNKDIIESDLINFFTQSGIYENWKNSIFSQATIQNIGADKYSLLDIPVPSIKEEQKVIANYLDGKTAAIDQLIAEKKQLAALYQEEKTAIINELVTGKKTWNGTTWAEPAEIKDSGIEWLGDIPEHWVIKKLNWCFNTISSGTTPKAGNQDYYFNGTHNWLLTGDLNDGEIYKTTKKITDKALNDYSSLKEYGENSVVIAMYGATIGKLGVLKIPTTVNQACCVLSEPTHLNYDFTFFLLLSARQEIINMSYGGGQPNISQELLKQFKIQVPPKEEQTQIVQHIEKESERIDAKIAKAEKYINLLTEYRTALISEVVTGKIKVT